MEQKVNDRQKYRISLQTWKIKFCFSLQNRHSLLHFDQMVKTIWKKTHWIWISNSTHFYARESLRDKAQYLIWPSWLTHKARDIDDLNSSNQLEDDNSVPNLVLFSPLFGKRMHFLLFGQQKSRNLLLLHVLGQLQIKFTHQPSTLLHI